MSVHPIEAESYAILERRVDLSGLPPLARAVVARVIHASADPDFAETMRVSEEAVEAGIAAIAAGRPVVADVEMVRVGVTAVPACCHLADVGTVPEALTRSAAAVRVAAERHPDGALVVVGCAPTALVEVVRLVDAGAFRPALVVALPVGFVGAAESKALARAAPVACISNVGEKGGSSVAAAVVNAIVRLAGGPPGRR